MVQYRDEPMEMNQAIKMADSLAQQQNKAMSIFTRNNFKASDEWDFEVKLNAVIQNNALLNLPEFKIDPTQ